MNSEASICNRALRYLGAPEILSLDKSSRNAELCSSHYPQVRDELLESYQWSFAKDGDSTNPENFPALFVEALARRLAAALAVPLAGSTRLEQVMLQRFSDALDLAQLSDEAERRNLTFAWPEVM